MTTFTTLPILHQACEPVDLWVGLGDGEIEGMEVTADDLLEAAAASHQALEPFVARDWSVQAGDLDWDVRRTVAHTGK
jgi:hypothetical protein